MGLGAVAPRIRLWCGCCADLCTSRGPWLRTFLSLSSLSPLTFSPPPPPPDYLPPPPIIFHPLALHATSYDALGQALHWLGNTIHRDVEMTPIGQCPRCKGFLPLATEIAEADRALLESIANKYMYGARRLSPHAVEKLNNFSEKCVCGCWGGDWSGRRIRGRLSGPCCAFCAAQAQHCHSATLSQGSVDVVVDGLNMGYWRKGFFDWQQVLDVMRLCRVWRCLVLRTASEARKEAGQERPGRSLAISGTVFFFRTEACRRRWS